MFNVRFVVVILGLIIFVPSLACAGSLDAPAAPTSATSAMYTIGDIFKELGSSTTAAKRTGAFTEPTAVPASTGHTLNEVMDLVRSRARAPKTGQTTLFVTKDDGDLEKGITWPNPRFTDNGDGTVTDNLTNLIWLDNANCSNGSRSWANALVDVGTLNSAGMMNGNGCGDTSNGGTFQIDWRLPNVKELQSLIHFGFSSPALPNAAGTAQWAAGDPFANVQSSNYWSSTTNVSNTPNAWLVSLSNGVNVNSFNKANTLFVWPVRGGQ